MLCKWRGESSVPNQSTLWLAGDGGPLWQLPAQMDHASLSPIDQLPSRCSLCWCCGRHPSLSPKQHDFDKIFSSCCWIEHIQCPGSFQQLSPASFMWSCWQVVKSYVAHPDIGWKCLVFSGTSNSRMYALKANTHQMNKFFPQNPIAETESGFSNT